jgi:hypothetical protein
MILKAVKNLRPAKVYKPSPLTVSDRFAIDIDLGGWMESELAAPFSSILD